MVFAMSFSKVYDLLTAKATKRPQQGRSEVTSGLTGYTMEQIDEFLNSEITYGDFFGRLPKRIPTGKRLQG